MRGMLFTLGIAAATAMTLSTADAGYRHHKHYRGMHAAHVSMHPRGAFRGQPNTCWTDEGYGRRAPCNARQ
jgi:hypothetical protein